MEYTAFDIGAHCTYCKQHDFLPFKCESCGLKFCLKHKDAEKHECTHLYCKHEGKKNNDGDESFLVNNNNNMMNTTTTSFNSLSFRPDYEVNNNNNNNLKERANLEKKKKKNKKKKKKNKCKVRGCKNPNFILFPCKCCNNDYCITHLQQNAHKCSALNLAALEAKQKHQAMLMSNEAKELAKLLKCKS